MADLDRVLKKLGLTYDRRLTDVDTPSTCDRSNYFGALRVLLEELSESDFLALFLSIVSNSDELISANGSDWQCADNYVSVLKGLVCDDYPCSSICAPKKNADVASIFDNIPTWGQFSFGGPDAAA